MPRSVDELIEQLAARQLGPVTRSQLRELGVSAHAITIGGVIAALLGLPLAVLAMLPLGNAGVFAIGYEGWQGVPPALAWSSIALIMTTGGAALCAAAALTGRLLRSLHRARRT